MNNNLDRDNNNNTERSSHESQHQQQLFSANPTYPGMLAGVHLRLLCRHRSTGPGGKYSKVMNNNNNSNH